MPEGSVRTQGALRGLLLKPVRKGWGRGRGGCRLILREDAVT